MSILGISNIQNNMIQISEIVILDIWNYFFDIW